MKLPVKTLDRSCWHALTALLARAAVTFFLSAGQLGEIYAPWTMAAVAVSGSGLSGLFALIGAACGGLLFFDFQTGLRHIAAAILIFAAAIAFSDSKLYDRPWFRPAAAAIMPILVQSVALIGRGFFHWTLCLAAAAAAALLTHWWNTPDKQLRMLLIFTGLCTALVPLSVNGFSPGQTCAAWLVLLLAGLSTPAHSAAMGAGIGLLLDLVPARPSLLLAMALGCGGYAAALCPHRRWSAAAFFACSSAIPVLFRADHWDVLLFQMMVAGIAYLCIPEKYLPKQDSAELLKPPSSSTPLRQGAAAFRELYDSFFRSSAPEKPENPSVLFDRAAEVVCRNCVLCPRCWQQEYNTTYDAFNHACPALIRRGQAKPEDFPSYFASRCIHFPDLLRAIDTELYAYLLRRQYRLRLSHVKELAAAQYAQMGELLNGTAQAVPAAAEAGLTCHTDFALRPKRGELLCGDQAEIFSVGSTLYLLLSDGMGSGESAHAEASMTVRLLRQFLQAGIDPLPALKTMNTALRLRCDSGGGFTTIDLLALQKTDGTTSLYKYGAAASYLKKNGRVTRFTSVTLPAGLQDIRNTPEAATLQLTDGAMMILVSDGITSNGDEWLQNLLAGWSSNIQGLAARIMTESESHGGLEDDCAVMVLQTENSIKNGRKHV